MMKQPAPDAAEKLSPNQGKHPNSPKRLLRATKSLDITESPRRSEKGEGSILEAYNEARTRGKKNIENVATKYRRGSMTPAGNPITTGSSAAENNLNVDASTNIRTLKIPRRKEYPLGMTDQLQPTAIKVHSKMHRRMSAGPSYGYENNLFHRHRNVPGIHQSRTPYDESSSHISQTEDDHEDESEYDSVVQSSVRSGTSKYLSDPSVYGTPRRSHSDGSQSSSTIDSGFETPIAQKLVGKNMDRSSLASDSVSSIGMSPSSFQKPRTKISPATNPGRNSPKTLVSLREESDRKLLNALHKMNSSNEAMTDDDDSSINSIRSAKLEDLKEMFSTSKRGNMKTKKRRKSNIIRSGSQSSLSITATPSSAKRALSVRSLESNSNHVRRLENNSNHSSSSVSSKSKNNDSSLTPNSPKGNNKKSDAGLRDEDSDEHDDDATAVSAFGDDSVSECDTIEVLGESAYSFADASNPSLQITSTSLDVKDENRRKGKLNSKDDTYHRVDLDTSVPDAHVQHRNELSHHRQPIYDSVTSKMHTSDETLPITNIVPVHDSNDNILNSPKKQRINNKSSMKNQIIESLVWFSFHIPRTVLEDLISHELEIWRRQHMTKVNNSGSSRRRKKNEQEQQSKTSRQFMKDGSSSHHTSKSQKSLTSQKSFASAGSSADGGGGDDASIVIDDADDNDNNSNSDGSVSSLSDEGIPSSDTVFDTNYAETVIRREGRLKSNDMIVLPKAVKRESAVLFVDMSGFTKLSTILDVESLSKVINSYFEMIVSEVISHGGDILKFAGDAFFAEWKVGEDESSTASSNNKKRPRRRKLKKNLSSSRSNPLSELNASLASISELSWDDHDIPPISMAVVYASKCATSIVQKYSDYHVTTASDTGSGPAMLNVHCGIGVGHLVGLHVGDYKENEEEEATELRREFLIMGDPIDQVAKAADIAKCGEVMASPEAMVALAFCCELKETQQMTTEPVCIASRDESFLKYEPFVVVDNSNALQPYAALRMHCQALNRTALARLHLQMALYVHPVIRGDELALSAAIQAGKISQPTEKLESRHRAEAELRSVFTMFITPMIAARITTVADTDETLYKKLGDIMHITSRELDRYSGHLRQFIVDDKGVVLIATFGLRGSTFPNMVENNGLPAAFAIHRALKQEVQVDNRIGCTFGKVYCGVVGGVRRHEFAVMGAPVNLAARLMGSKVNTGILVDEAVRDQCIGRYSFKSLPPVTAKGYDKPVSILEPIQIEAKQSKKKKSSFPIIGRRTEKRTVLSVARGIIEEPLISQSTMIFLTGESGMGKTAVAVAILDELKKSFAEEKSVIVTARSSSTETEQRIPLSSYRKIFMSIIRDRCEFDDGMEHLGRSSAGSVTGGTSRHSLKSASSSSRRGRMLASAAAKATSAFEALAEESVTEIDTGESSMTDRSSRSIRGRSTALSALSLTQHHKQKSSRYNVSNHMGRSSHGARKADTLSHSLHRVGLQNEKGNRRESLNIRQSSLMRTQSMRMGQPKLYSRRSSKTFREDLDESAASIDTSFQKQGSSGQYFEKLCWACEKLDYPFEYADIVGSQFLGFENASPVTHVDGHVPTMDELVEFLALALIQITDHADLITIFLDDFHWVDAFSWRIFRVLCKKAKKLILLSATRSHDKQALRRMSTALAPENQLQSQMIEISLGPLDFSEIRELMAAVLDHKKSAIPDALCTDIFQRTGGLPVYVVQTLENIKRKKTLELVDGVLKWTAEGLIEKKNLASSKNGAVMEETFLSRFDALDVRVRKVLQTCAVLGLSFALSDVIQVHPEMEEHDIENALECAMDEMILVEQVEGDDDADDDASGRSGSSRESVEDYTSNKLRGDSERHRSTGGERFFQFSHAMWRKNVLATMLKERKMELHRVIAESMEKDEIFILEQSDISRLLTLFDHWKSCGEFCKVAPLALAVGCRLEEWDLAAQSLELYEDALEMAFDGVQPTDQATSDDDEWIQVKAKPIVLDLILRLHIQMGMCHQRLGQDYQSILYFQDAYNIIKSASKMSGMSEALVMPIISSLCVLILEEEASGDPQAKTEHVKLVHTFVQEAFDDGDAVHIGRALALQALYLAKHGDFRGALESVKRLENSYDIEENCEDMIAEYGRDFAMECMAESVQWLYLMGNHDEAENKAEKVIKDYIPLLDPADTDQMMFVVLPIIQVFSLLDRASDADQLLKTYIINPYHDYESPSAAFWAPLFNPLAYLIEIIMMDDEDQHDPQILEEMEDWVLDEENLIFEKELERKAHTIMGELCWRLALVKDDEDDAQILLLRKARELLEPVAFYPHYEIFQKQTAQALLDAL